MPFGMGLLLPPPSSPPPPPPPALLLLLLPSPPICPSGMLQRPPPGAAAAVAPTVPHPWSRIVTAARHGAGPPLPCSRGSGRSGMCSRTRPPSSRTWMTSCPGPGAPRLPGVAFSLEREVVGKATRSTPPVPSPRPPPSQRAACCRPCSSSSSPCPCCSVRTSPSPRSPRTCPPSTPTASPSSPPRYGGAPSTLPSTAAPRGRASRRWRRSAGSGRCACSWTPRVGSFVLLSDVPWGDGLLPAAHPFPPTHNRTSYLPTHRRRGPRHRGRGGGGCA
jgi:hypothetical protein